MRIELAKSLSGHDKDRYYLVIKEDGDAVYLADGGVRPLARPKKKNKKHVQRVKRVPEEVVKALSDGRTDVAVKRAIKLYEQYINRRKENVEGRCD